MILSVSESAGVPEIWDFSVGRTDTVSVSVYTTLSPMILGPFKTNKARVSLDKSLAFFSSTLKYVQQASFVSNRHGTRRS